MLHEEITSLIIGRAFEGANELGAGFLESVYEKALCVALRQKNVRAKCQHPVKVCFRGECVGDFIADLLVEDVVLVELKAAKNTNPSTTPRLRM